MPAGSSPDTDVELLTVPQVAERAKVSRASVYQWLGSGELRSLKLGAARRVSVEALRDFLEQREAETMEALL